MDDKIKIEIFGIKNQPAGGSCLYSCSFGPVQTIGEQYKELVKFLEKKYFANRLDLKFVEINKENLEKLPEINKLLDEGYYFPLTLINGKLKLNSFISNEVIFDLIIKSLA
ncbi:MAG: hypothetical protein M1409_05910 [Actinobacteria bacterium]|nr:hypothetical protein [Actinomycetota bacterium]